MSTKLAIASILVIMCMLSAPLRADTFTIKSYCKYVDFNSVDSLMGGRYAEAFFSIHSKEANDLADQYKGRFDIDASVLTMTPASCLEIKFGDNQESNIKEYIKIPIVPSAKNDDRTNIAANSYAYVPLLKDALYTTYTQKTYGDLHTLLRESAFSSDTVTNGKGMVIGMNDKGGYNFVLRQQYKISFTAPATADASAMCSMKDLLYRNCAVVHGPIGIAYDGPREHFFSTYKINFTVWIFSVLVLIYFIWSVGTSVNDPLIPHYEGSTKFNHSFYSVWVFGNPRQTKISRLTSILCTLMAHTFAASAMHRALLRDTEGARIGVGVAVGFGFGWLTTYFFAFFLNRVTRVHRTFLTEIKTAKTHDEKLACLDKYDNSRCTWNYIYYSLAFAFVMGCGWGSQGLTIDNFDNTRFWYLFLTIGICWVGQYVILDWLPVILGKGVGCLAGFMQYRGFYLDYQLHKDFESYQADQE